MMPFQSFLRGLIGNKSLILIQLSWTEIHLDNFITQKHLNSLFTFTHLNSPAWFWPENMKLPWITWDFDTVHIGFLYKIQDDKYIGNFSGCNVLSLPSGGNRMQAHMSRSQIQNKVIHRYRIRSFTIQNKVIHRYRNKSIVSNVTAQYYCVGDISYKYTHIQKIHKIHYCHNAGIRTQ